ncbi:hypothetical protein [Pseudoalteromonas sp. ASV78]|uniref:hypothetical protein n=1 Tax=Pseudoalteromonas sp. ASV78 TaxID=3397851 RepID=UPI0039FCE127
MMKNKLSKVLIALPLCFITSCSASQNESMVVFKCHANEPTSIDVVITEAGGTYQLEQFNTAELKLANIGLVNDVRKLSYHRSLVTEHSIVFAHDDNEITVSDYYSEEFDTVTKEKSVTLQKNNSKKYWICDSTAISTLASIEDF